MNNFILVHGAWGGAWEFEKVVRALTKLGNKVTAVDLPGHGNNLQRLSDVTMQAYVNEVVGVINKQQENVVLVGHSLAGAVIAQVAELVPDNIDRLIFVAAILPENGQSALTLMQSDENGLLPHVIFSDDQSSATVAPDTVRSLLLNDVTDEHRLKDLVPNFLFCQATEPFLAEAKLTEERFGKVAKYYIRAGKDKVLSPALQDEMLNSWEVDGLSHMESGHFPLISEPDALISILIEATS